MITFKKLTFQNAFSWGDRVEIPLEDQGVVFISGNNGAGKSSIFEVLTHAIYQATSKGLRKNAIINRVTGVNYAAELVFETNGHEYKIRQYRRHKKMGSKTHFFKDGELQHSRNTGADEVHKNVIQEIGIILKEFLGIVYLSQGMTHILVEGRPSERKAYLSNIFQLDVYDRMQERAEEQLGEIRHKISHLAPKMMDRESTELEMSRLSDPKKSSDILYMLKAFKRSGKSTLMGMRSDFQELSTKTSMAQHRENILAELPEGLVLFDVKEELFACIRKQKASETSFRKLTTLRDGARRRQELVGELDEWGGLTGDIHKITQLRDESTVIQSQIAELNTRIRSVNKWNSLAYDRDKLRSLLSSEPHEIKAAVRDAHSEHSVMVENGKRIRSQLDNLNDIGKSSTCPKCFQELDPDAVAEHSKEISQELSTMRLAVHNLRKKIGKLETEEKIADELMSIESRMSVLQNGDVDELNQELDKLKTALTGLNSRINTASNVKLLADEIGKLPIGNTEEITEEMSNLENEIADLHEQIDGLRDNTSKLESLKSLPVESLSALDKSRESLQIEMSDLEIHLEKMTLETALLEAQVDKYIQLRGKLETLNNAADEYNGWKRKEEILEELRYCFGPKGLKLLKLKKIVSAIQDILPIYTSIMFADDPMDFVTSVEGNDLEMSAIRKTDSNDIIIPVKGLSGGQRQRLTISLLFTLQKILSPTKRSNILILDEVGAHLDVAGRDAFIELIQKLKGEHSSIFIMTHDVQLAGAINYDQMWQIGLKNGISSFEPEFKPTKGFANPNKPAQSTI